jgi:hypothetical protein
MKKKEAPKIQYGEFLVNLKPNQKVISEQD